MDENEARLPASLGPPTLGLRLRLGERTWAFELGPGEERAIVVGCLFRAHVRIDRQGIAPVHFHFEREGNEIRLVPGYRSDLLINGAPVSGVRTLAGRSVIEFSGYQMEVEIIALVSAAMTVESLRTLVLSCAVSESSRALIHDAAGSTSERHSAGLSKTLPIGLATVHADLSLHWPSRGPAGCQTATYQLRDESCPRTSVPPPPILRSLDPDAWPASERASRSAKQKADAALDCDELAAACAFVAPPLLARLGTLAMHRPILAAVGALAGSLVLALFMLVVSRCFFP